MGNNVDELAEKAYRLAFFLLGDTQSCWQVLEKAFALLPIATRKQVRRGYHKQRTHARKTIFTEAQQLQYLVLEQSTLYEKQAERAGDPPDGEMLRRRYVKFIVQRAMPNTAFYTAVGLGRLLYHYSTVEAAAIYEYFEPDRVLPEANYRRARGKLYKELKHRFEPLLKETTAPDGEKFFVTEPEPSQWLQALKTVLDTLTPWHTRCRQAEPGEISRIHAIIHPPCLDFILAELYLPEPGTRLRVPRFEIPMTNQNKPPEEPIFEPKKVRALQKQLQNQQVARIGLQPQQLILIVDGEERTHWDLTTNSFFSLRTDEFDRNLEIWAETDSCRTPLAMYSLPQQSWDEPEQNEENEEIFELEGGFALEITPDLGEPGLLRFTWRLPQVHTVSWLSFVWWRKAVGLPRWSLPLTIGLVLVLGVLLLPQRPPILTPDQIDPGLRSNNPTTLDQKELQPYNSTIAKAIFERGRYLLQQDRDEAALADFELAYRLNPNYTRALEHIILVAERLGLTDKVNRYKKKL